MKRIKPNRIRRGKRGISMLLVMVSLMMATILATGYLAAQDNSTAVSQNVAASDEARWIAESGLGIGQAILQTNHDWRTLHDVGTLVRNTAMGSGSYTIKMTDALTGLPPTAATEYVNVKVEAVADGVQQTATAMARVPTITKDTLEIDLGEFATFTSDRLELQDRGLITRWPKSPETKARRRIAIGTNATSAGSIDLQGDAAIIDGAVYHGPGASSSLVTSNSGGMTQTGLLDAIPLVSPPSSGVAEPSGGGSIFDLLTGLLDSVTGLVRRLLVNISGGSVLTLNPGSTLVVDDDLNLSGSGSKIAVNGTCTLVVFGDLNVTNGATIELGLTGRLRLFVRGDINLDNGYIGDQRIPAVNDVTGNARWMQLTRLLIFSMPGGSSNWRLRGQSVVKASIYAPHINQFEIEGSSALYGRVAAPRVRIREDGVLFYDHGLSSDFGYTSEKSLVFESDGHIKSAIRTLASLNTSDLQTLANDLDADVRSLGTTLLTDAVAVPSPPGGAEDPTPRPVQIEWEILSLGTSVHEWEASGS